MNYRAHAVALRFEQIADLMEIGGIESYKAPAYRRGARSIRKAGDRLHDLLAEDRLDELDGIGPALADKAREIVETGRCEQLERLTDRVPRSLLDLLNLEGLGIKTVYTLYHELNIESLQELEVAAREKRLRRLPGIGSRREQTILASIMRERERSKGITLDWADSVVQELIRRLQSLRGAASVLPVGAVRRRCELIDRVSVLVEMDNDEDLTPGTRLLSGVARAPLREGSRFQYPYWEMDLDIGIPVRIYRTPLSTAGSARVRLTGNAAHTRQLQAMGLDGISDLPTEDEVYSRLEMTGIPPELREGRGEVELARAGEIPPLVQGYDLIGDLHCHSDWSDGNASIEEMVEGAIEFGLKYLAITDHSRSLQVAGGLDVQDLKRQGEEIARVQDSRPDFSILRGVEVDILSDGQLDLPDEVLDDMDVVVASLHSGRRQESGRLTERLIEAARHPSVDILGHPTARLLGVRETDTPNLREVLEVCAEADTAVEINAHPDRLDLPWYWLERARELDIPLAINSDAHSPDGFALLAYGVDCARKGGCERRHILNAEPVPQWLDPVRAD